MKNIYRYIKKQPIGFLFLIILFYLCQISRLIAAFWAAFLFLFFFTSYSTVGSGSSWGYYDEDLWVRPSTIWLILGTLAFGDLFMANEYCAFGLFVGKFPIEESG